MTYYGIVGLQPALAPCTLFKTYVAEYLDDSLLHACNYPVSQLTLFLFILPITLDDCVLQQLFSSHEISPLPLLHSKTTKMYALCHL